MDTSFPDVQAALCPSKSSPQVQRPPPAVSVSCHTSNVQTTQCDENSNSVRWARVGNSETVQVSNNAYVDHTPASEVEYTAPTLQPERRCLVLPRPPSVSSKHPHAPHTRAIDQKPHYDRCNVVLEMSARALNDRSGPLAPQPTMYPGITAQYSQLEVVPED